VLRKGPGELAASVTISLKPKRQMFTVFVFALFIQKILKNVSNNNYSTLLTCLDYILNIVRLLQYKEKNICAMSNSMFGSVVQCTKVHHYLKEMVVLSHPDHLLKTWCLWMGSWEAFS